MKTNFYILLFFLLSSCGSNEKQESKTVETKPKTVNSNFSIAPDTTSDVQLTSAKNFTHSEIAKFTIASIMSKNPNTLKVKKANDDYIVSYNLDGKLYSYKVQIMQFKNQVMWGNIDGRWRNHNMDEKVFFEENGDKLNIIQKFSDSSQSIDEYSH